MFQRITDLNLFYRGGELMFPLYIYPQIENKKQPKFSQMLMLFEPEVEYGVESRIKLFSGFQSMDKRFIQTTDFREQVFSTSIQFFIAIFIVRSMLNF